MEQSTTAFLSAIELGKVIGSGALRAERFVADRLADIEARDASAHAWVEVYADTALAAARSADLAIGAGQRLGPLHGVPIGIKDIIDIEGRVTTGGSAVWRDRRSPVTATLVQRLVQAGLVILGKTHSVEFAMGGWGTNTHMGTPRNPWDRSVHRAPGGSSAGSGVAVAEGMVPCAIGTDTGGSVRLPAAWNGLTGLKTSIGRISCHGVLPLSTTLDTPGPLCRTVADAAVLLTIMQGPDPADPRTRGLASVDPLQELHRGVRGLRLARLPAAELASVDAEMLTAYETALEQLAALGVEIVSFTPPLGMSAMGDMAGRIIGIEGYHFVGDLVDDRQLPIDPDVRPRIHLGRGVSARDYLALLAERQALKQSFETALVHCDGVLTPSTRGGAPAVADIDQKGTPATFTRFVNVLDWCALTVPCGATQAGLPLGLQIACRGGREDLALRIGQAYQNATRWHLRHPH